MKTIQEIIAHLNILPDEFRKHYEAGQYAWAAHDYTHAKLVSHFIRMPEPERLSLLNRFPREQVEDAFRRTGG
jgi:hypothetical protein